MTKAPWKPDICVHHFPCDDGFGAAWTVWKKWGNTVEFIGLDYGNDLSRLPEQLSGKHILFVDFSVSADLLCTLASEAKSLILLDHHVTAEKQLAPFVIETEFHYNSVYGPTSEITEKINQKTPIAYFNMEKSGAKLAWEFCFPGENIPDFIDYIEDLDLWRLQMPNAREFSLALRSYPYDFETWESLSQDVKSLIAQGEHIKRFYDKKVQDICKMAIYKTIAGHKVLIVNSPHFMASDVAHALLKQDETIAFAACWYESEKGLRFSLRSDDTREDVSKVAEKFGGGGHRNASGFSLESHEQLKELNT